MTSAVSGPQDTRDIQTRRETYSDEIADATRRSLKAAYNEYLKAETGRALYFRAQGYEYPIPSAGDDSVGPVEPGNISSSPADQSSLDDLSSTLVGTPGTNANANTAVTDMVGLLLPRTTTSASYTQGTDHGLHHPRSSLMYNGWAPRGQAETQPVASQLNEGSKDIDQSQGYDPSRLVFSTSEIEEVYGEGEKTASKGTGRV